MILTKFEETPIMSTYLLAIIVSDLTTLDANINSKISIYAPVRVRNYE
jgi:aminopeptidase N